MGQNGPKMGLRRFRIERQISEPPATIPKGGQRLRSADVDFPCKPITGRKKDAWKILSGHVVRTTETATHLHPGSKDRFASRMVWEGRDVAGGHAYPGKQLNAVAKFTTETQQEREERSGGREGARFKIPPLGGGRREEGWEGSSAPKIRPTPTSIPL